jgi:ABC-2 type transport system ATP-binding protein
MLAVETLELTKDYYVGFFRKRPRRAVDGLNLRVEKGEVFGLLGPNGAGKTTTLKILLRLVFPTSGTARILGSELEDVAMHGRVGYLPENPYFYDHLTAQEFMNYAGELFGLRPTERRRRIDRLLERLGLAESRHLPLRKFSKGMVQRVGIAQALINDPELIFLDEPMSGLDPLGRREVRDLILELKDEGKTIFFSTHILSDAEVLCDRVAILHRGRLQGCGELHEILSLGVAVTEVVLENPPAELLRELSPYTRSLVRTGRRVRLEVPAESDVARVLALAIRHAAGIVSLNPVKMSLEDYFMAQVGATPNASQSREAVAVPDPERGKK